MSGQSNHPEFAEAQFGWRPPRRRYTGEIHELLDGVLRSGEQRHSEYGPYPSLVFELADDQALTVAEIGDKDRPAELRQLGRGDTVRLAVLGEVLRREFRDAQPQPGDRLKVAYYGKTGDQYVSPQIWRVRHTGGRFDATALFGQPGTAVDGDSYAPDVPADAEGLTATPANRDGNGDDGGRVPF
jgi:hypothetical protein